MNRFLLLALCVLLCTDSVFPCSAIVLKNGPQILLAKNFDWTYREGMLIKNPRGAHKTAYFTQTGEPAQWTSVYGSVTFNQNGKEMPYGGMNEKGLVVEMLWLEYTKYNVGEARKYVNELEWIQYQLDNFKNVQEVAEHLNDLKIYPVKGKIHYILTDAAGESVVVEYMEGKPNVYKKEANTCQAITNYPVPYSAQFKNQVKGIRKKNTAHLYRYYRMEQQIAQLTPASRVDEPLAFDVLKEVTISKGGFKTMWSIVYNIPQKTISFFTDTNREIKTVGLSELDFTGHADYFELNQNKVKKLNTGWKPLTEEANFSCMSPSLIHLGFDELLTRDMSRHQMLQTEKNTSVFSEGYFHFEISLPIEQEKQRGFVAVMDSEKAFNKRQAVTGGYLNGTIGKTTYIMHIYGLKNGRYAMVAFIDDNKNGKLDFENGKALEKYATFSDRAFTREKEILFSTTSADFNRENARFLVKWKD